ncbi:MAG: phosphatidate cytidylyltransferase [Parvibaculales bacterium]
MFTALTLLPVVLGALYYGHWVFVGLVLLVALLLVHEWTAMLKAARLNTVRMLLACLVVSSLCVAAVSPPETALLFWLGAVLISGLVALTGWVQLPVLMGGYAYLALPLVAMIELRQMEGGDVLVFSLFVLVWLTDIFAMLAGKTIGGPRLAPVISPNKTWAGLLGGMAGASAGGTALALIFGWRELLLTAFLSAGFAVLAQLGDLLESWIKRRYDVKDSGTLLPGHGGLLDRVDGLISVLAITFLVLLATRRMTEDGMTALLVW